MADIDKSSSNGILYLKDTVLMKQLNLERVREDTQKLRAAFIENVDQQLAGLMDDALSKLGDQMEISSDYDNLNKKNLNSKNGKSNELPDKIFIQRDSLLTELLKINHIQTIYNIFVAVLMLLFLNTVLSDFVDSGKINLDFDMMTYAFGKGQTVLTVWVLMKLSLIAVLFPIFHFWAHHRSYLKHLYSPDLCFLILYIFYICGLMILPVRIIIHEEIPPASAVIILAEQVRLIMKAHAFIRENVPRAVHFKYHQDGDKSVDTPCPDFGKFLYFLFVPTLIYRDNYPRTTSVCWKYVTVNFIQVLACLFYIYYIFQRFCVPIFRKFGHERFTPKGLLLSVFGCMMPGTLVLLITFFAILHSWMNAFAEMLRFADRMFYKDWWNSTSFSNYYRTWNIVVHDWLYTYIYKDLYKLTGSKKMGPMFIVFLLSALVHEYILTFAFRFFYPVLLFLFGGFGVFFVFLTNKGKSRSWNVFMWTALFMGTGLLMSLYSMEWYARSNCPVKINSFVDYIIPRSWTCDAFTIG